MELVTEDNITELATARWATARDPRLAEIMTSLVRHLHGFAREVRLTEAEWIAAMGWLKAAGHISRTATDEVASAATGVISGVKVVVKGSSVKASSA